MMICIRIEIIFKIFICQRQFDYIRLIPGNVNKPAARTLKIQFRQTTPDLQHFQLRTLVVEPILNVWTQRDDVVLEEVPR